MKISTEVLCLFLLLIGVVNNQALQFDGFIQTRKLFLFGPDSGFQYTELNKTHQFLFERTFNNVPRVGLAVYTLDFEYSPEFSCQITAATNKTSTAILVRSANQNRNNRLYIMYIATDHPQIGIFVPQRLVTTQLSLPSRTKNSQSFDFNFKEDISSYAKSYTEISVSVYLTGLSTTSQMTTNGYPTNRTSVNLRIITSSAKFYTIQVSINKDYTDTLIDWVMCTVVYFIPNVMINNRYQMNSAIATLRGYGGTLTAVTQSIDLVPFVPNEKFEDLKFFFGISNIDCKDGQNIAILGVEKYFTGTDGSMRLLMQMQTWKLTFMLSSSFNYIQYNSLKCSEPGANCNSTCSKDLRPYFMVSNECKYCHYSCMTCNVSNSDKICDTCHATRTLNPNTKLCDCKPQYYETRESYICADCFPCETCQKINSCTTCLQSQHMVLNSVTSECLCKAGYYPNLVTQKNVQVYSKTQTCLKCKPNCLYCISINECKACTIETYLLNGQCIPICKASERFITTDDSCAYYDGDLFDQQGRLAFDWSFKTENNELIIDLIFSQANMEFHYYENEKGYSLADYVSGLGNGAVGGGGNSGASLYYDDGLYFAGYTDSDSALGGGSGSGNGFGSGGGSGSGSGNNGSLLGDSNGGSMDMSSGTIDESALRGQYYGFGQKRFFQLLFQNQSALFKDQNFIPFGKYNLSTSLPVQNPNFIDALAQNLVFKISGQPIPYTIQGVSSNRFTLRTRPVKTYMNALTSLEIKNPGLVRSDKTALQKSSVTKQLDRFDFYTQQQLTSASTIKNSNSVLVDILWGLSKYFLFVGLGWPFLPLMISLQLIMSFNYIKSSLPLNLRYFLASFKDFRNPSILFNPTRDQFDRAVLTHQNIYKSIPEFEVFDRGIDFMKNSFQFFFVPFLACALLLLLFLINLALKKLCKRDFPLISKYLVPRAPLLIAAYTLVQALPVSFFFFAQLNDTTFRHPLEPTAAYPTFNSAMAFLAFFLTCAIPILLLAWLYYHFNYGTRISQFSDANVFNRKFLNKIDDQSGKFNRAQLQDPLWGGSKTKPGSYIFGIAIFFFLIASGFFLSFFIKSFGWQLAGLLVFSVLFLSFIIGGSFFDNKVTKVFLIIYSVLLIGYLLLHAGLGSNRSIGTYDQWNTGYLGIGILYGFIITAILFTAYLVYKLFKEMYSKGKKQGWWVDTQKKNEVAATQRKQVQRVTQYRRDTKLKSAFLKNGPSAIGVTSNLQNNLLGSQFKDTFLGNNLRKQNTQDNDYVMPSQQRMIVHSYDRPQTNNYEQLILNKQDPYKKQISFISKDRNIVFGFPQQNGRMLLSKQPIYIDDQNRIYDKNKEFIDFYSNLSKRQQVVSRKDINKQQSQQAVGKSNNIVYETIKTNKEIFVINDEEFEKVGQESDGSLRLKNRVTGEIKNFNMGNLKKASSSLLKYNSNSDIKITQDYDIDKSSRPLNANKHIIYNGEQYLDLGYDSYSKQFKFLNPKTNAIERVPRARYIRMVQDSLGKRLTIGDDDYDYQGTDQYGKVYLTNNRNKKQLVITNAEFDNYKDMNLKAFHKNIENNMVNTEDRPIVVYQGQEYESYGLDEQGKHRLYNPKQKKFISISDYDFKNISVSSKSNLAGPPENLLMLQSAIGSMKRLQSAKQQQTQQQVNEIKLDSQTSKFFIFEQQNGEKFYVPKSKIDLDQPIQLDDDGNLSQNGRTIMNIKDPKGTQKYYQRKTQVIISSTSNLPSQQQVTYQSRTINNYENPQMNVQTQNFEQLQEDDAINPDKFYKILGIPEQKVIDFQFKPKDVYLTERNIKGKDVMQRVQKIQQKYPNLLLLIRNESNQTEEFWIR